MNIHRVIILVVGLLVSIKGHAEITREVRRIRTNAINELSFTLPCTFIVKKDFLKALQFIEQDLPDAVHQKLLELQARAAELYEQREQMLMIPGVTEAHPSVKELDARLRDVERDLDGLLYNDGVFNWRSMLAVTAGVGAGVAAGTGHLMGMRGKTGWKRGLLVGVLVVLLIEFALRGRRALLAGNLLRVLGSIGKFLGKLLGGGGYWERVVVKLERKFRPIGTRLEKLFGKRAAPITITVLALIVVAIVVSAASRAAESSKSQ